MIIILRFYDRKYVLQIESFDLKKDGVEIVVSTM